jgi:hypothetical protein
MLLDDILASYDFTEVHTIRIKATREVAFRATLDTTLSEISGIVRLLFFLRELPEKMVGHQLGSLKSGQPLLRQMLEDGFTKLSEEPAREIVFGTIVPGQIGRVWKKSSSMRVNIADSSQFIAFKHPDYLQVVANMLVTDSEEPDTVIVRTESRTRALSPQARKNFHPYWRIIRPFSGLIRRFWLRGIKRRAEGDISPPVA